MSKIDLVLDPPILNAAGSLGFFPDPHGTIEFRLFGAFITNPISTAPRQPAKGARWIPFSGGALIHSGYPNPGLKEAIRRYASRWHRSIIPILVHLLAENTDQVGSALRILEETEAVAGVELGLPPGIEPLDACRIIEAALGELPIIARVPSDAHSELIREIDRIGITAISICPPRGALPFVDGSIISGRIYGPCIFPLMLAHLRSLEWMRTDLITCGGVYKSEDVAVLLSAGATAVQLDSVLWRDQWLS